MTEEIQFQFKDYSMTNVYRLEVFLFLLSNYDSNLEAYSNTLEVCISGGILVTAISCTP